MALLDHLNPRKLREKLGLNQDEFWTRIGLTLYRLASILDGDLDEVIHALVAARAQQQLEALETGA